MSIARADLRAARLAMVSAGLAIGSQVAAKSLREGLFLANFAVADLPKAMLGAALVAIPAALVVARLMTRFGPARLGPAMFTASAALSLLEWWLLPSLPKLVAISVYLHVSVGGALLVSSYWSIVNERFDPYTLKRLVGRIGASATLGGLVGGLVMERFATWFTARGGLIIVATLAVIAGVCMAPLGKSSATLAVAPSDAKAHRFTSYLWTLAMIVACSAAVSAFADFALKQAAAARFANVDSLVRFFALLYTGTSLIGFLIQVFVARRVLALVGVGGTLALPPLFAMTLGIAGLLSPSMGVIGALRGSDLSLGPSLFRSAFEPLFTPVAPAVKRRAKALIDVVFDKGGEIVASTVILALASAGPGLVARAPLLLVSITSALGVYLAFLAQRGYVRELESSLRAGTLELDAHDSGPAAQLALSGTAVGMDREKLLEQIARVRQAELDAAHSDNDAPLSADNERIVDDVSALLGTSSNAIRAVLSRPDLDPRLATFVLPFLARDAFTKPAIQALRGIGRPALGVLADAMLSTGQAPLVRRRVPHVLRDLRTPEAARVLTLGLGADDYEVRRRSALALLEVTADDSTLGPPKPEAVALVARELERGPLARDAVDHLFALLALCLNRGALELARQGILSGDRKLAGTALEYLESILPEPLRAGVIAALSEHAGSRRESRRPAPGAELHAELQRSFRAELTLPGLSREPD